MSGEHWISTGNPGQDMNWLNPNNWSAARIPASSDDVYFDVAMTTSCTNAGAGLTTLQSLHIRNAYNQTLTMANALSIGTLEMSPGDGGKIDQPSSGLDLTVTASLNWTSGTINSTDNLANLSVSGATATIAPASAGTVNSGDNLTFVNSAVGTLNAGTITFTNDGFDMNVDANCGLIVDPGADKESNIQLSPGLTQGGKVTIASGGYARVLTGVWHATTTSVVNSGEFTLMPSTTAWFTAPEVGAPPDYEQQAGLTQIYKGALLKGTGSIGIELNGGTLSYMLNQGTGAATIEATNGFWFNGGFITSAANSLDGNPLFGELHVVGNVTWRNGTYSPHVSSENSIRSDVWTITGTLTLPNGNTAALAPAAIDDENNPVMPPSGRTWQLTRAAGGILGNFPTYDPAVWFILQVNNPVNGWDLRSV